MGLFWVVPFFEEEESLRGEKGDEGIERQRCVVWGIYIDDVEEGSLFCEERKRAAGVKRNEAGLGFDVEKGDVLLDAGDGVAVLFDERGVGGSATEGFESHGAAASEKVEKARVGNFILADIEDGLSEHPLGWAGRGAFGGFEEAPFECAGNNAKRHLKATCKS